MKRVIISGGGKLAYYLIDSLHRMDVDVTLIELNDEQAMRIVNSFEKVRVISGDGTTLTALESANCRNADFYVAATGKDEDNLVGCQLAKKHFHVKTTVARVNNPKNIALFKLLNVDLVYNSTRILSDLIEHNIQYDGMQVVFNIRDTPQYIVEAKISPKSKAIGIPFSELSFPGNTRVVLITRKDRSSVIPTGVTRIKDGDVLLLVTEERYYDEIYDLLVR